MNAASRHPEPTARGCDAGTEPLPMNVVAAGASSASAIATNSALAPLRDDAPARPHDRPFRGTEDAGGFGQLLTWRQAEPLRRWNALESGVRDRLREQVERNLDDRGPWGAVSADQTAS